MPSLFFLQPDAGVIGIYIYFSVIRYCILCVYHVTDVQGTQYRQPWARYLVTNHAYVCLSAIQTLVDFFQLVILFVSHTMYSSVLFRIMQYVHGSLF